MQKSENKNRLATGIAWRFHFIGGGGGIRTPGGLAPSTVFKTNEWPLSWESLGTSGTEKVQ